MMLEGWWRLRERLSAEERRQLSGDLAMVVMAVAALLVLGASVLGRWLS